MIITDAGNEENFRHYADGRVYWVSPFATEQELDYSDEWTEDRRMQGAYFEETMPPADLDAAQTILDDGTLVPGMVRTTSFDELSVTKQFVSFVKLLAEFQPLSVYNGAVVNLNGEFIKNVSPKGNFAGFVATHYLDYVRTHEPGVSGHLVDPFPLRPRRYPRYLFFAKINLPVFDKWGNLSRTDRIYYPIKSINVTTHGIYKNLYDEFARSASPAADEQRLDLMFQTTRVAFDINALADELSLFKIIKDYCTAIGYTLRMETNGGGYFWNTNIDFSAHEQPLPIFSQVPFLPDELGEGCRLVANNGKLLAAQHNYVVMGGKKIWGISQNDPLLPQEGNVAETGAVVFGNLSDGIELIANQSDSDGWEDCHDVAHFALRSPLWPERLFSMLGAWNVTFETHFFNFYLPKSTPFFQYENWLCALSSVARAGTRYRIEAVMLVARELLSGISSQPQYIITQGLMTPVDFGLDFQNYIPLRGGGIFYFAQIAADYVGSTDAEVLAVAEENVSLANSVGLSCTILQASLSCLAFRYSALPRTRYYSISDDPLDDRWFEPLPSGDGAIYARLNGSRFSEDFNFSALDGEKTLLLQGELRSPLNLVAWSNALPTITVEDADGSAIVLGDSDVVDNLDGHNRYNAAICRGYRTQFDEIEKITITPNGSLVHMFFVLEEYQ